MKSIFIRRPVFLLTIVLVICVVPYVRFASVHSAPPLSPRFERIDAHAHVYSASSRFFSMLRRLNIRVINICVVDKHDNRDPRRKRIDTNAELQNRIALSVFRKSDGRAPWVSTFEPSSWETPGFSDRVIKQLDDTFSNGAVGVKIYKTIGMELKSKKTGKYVMPDDPVFSPILDHIAERGKTLYAHIAEPAFEWVPLDPNSPKFKEEDQFWNIYGHSDRPSKAEILAARDRMLEQHPKLRVIGCHLGSMEDDVDEIAKRFDRYPNFAVDTSGRITDLMKQPRGKVRAFLIKYQDRVLYGVDEDLYSWQDASEKLKDWENAYATDWKYFATPDTIVVKQGTIQGLALPEPVLRKIFHDNAVAWVSGIAKD